MIQLWHIQQTSREPQHHRLVLAIATIPKRDRVYSDAQSAAFVPSCTNFVMKFVEPKTKGQTILEYYFIYFEGGLLSRMRHMKTAAPQKMSCTQMWDGFSGRWCCQYWWHAVEDNTGIPVGDSPAGMSASVESLPIEDDFPRFPFLRDFTDLAWNIKWLLQARKHLMWMEVVEGRKRTISRSQRSCALDFEQNAVEVPAQLWCWICYWIPSSCSRFSGAPNDLLLHHLLTKYA